MAAVLKKTSGALCLGGTKGCSPLAAGPWVMGAEGTDPGAEDTSRGEEEVGGVEEESQSREVKTFKKTWKQRPGHLKKMVLCTISPKFSFLGTAYYRDLYRYTSSLSHSYHLHIGTLHYDRNEH